MEVWRTLARVRLHLWISTNQAPRLKKACSAQLIMKFKMLRSIKIKKISLLHAQMSLKCYFFLLINVEVPTIAGILTFMSRKDFKLR